MYLYISDCSAECIWHDSSVVQQSDQSSRLYRTVLIWIACSNACSWHFSSPLVMWPMIPIACMYRELYFQTTLQAQVYVLLYQQTWQGSVLSSLNFSSLTQCSSGAWMPGFQCDCTHMCQWATMHGDHRAETKWERDTSQQTAESTSLIKVYTPTRKSVKADPQVWPPSLCMTDWNGAQVCRWQHNEDLKGRRRKQNLLSIS